LAPEESRYSDTGAATCVEKNGISEDSAAIVVLTNQDAAPASGTIARQIATALFTTEDKLAESRTAQAKAIFDGLQRGTIDRTLFTSNANAYLAIIG
jgi:secreted trypsin-like serine protease